MAYRVDDLYEQHGERLGLNLVAGAVGMQNRIVVPEAHRPGISLSGYLKGHARKRILIFGKVEIEYLRKLSSKKRFACLKPIITFPTPAVVVARHYRPPEELIALCEEIKIPLFRAKMMTMNLLSRLTLLLLEEFAPTISVHGTLVDVFGVGVLIQGDSSVGKSEAGLGLVERGHRLISDDIVRVRRKEDNFLEGQGTDLLRHHMELRGIGIINVAHLHGAVCVRERKAVNLVVKLEEWDDQKAYDRIGIHDQHCQILGVDVPSHVLPVKPGRDVVLLVETIALNHRLKQMGYHSAQEFCAKQAKKIAEKHERKRV